MTTILILGGTAEAVEIARRVAGLPGTEVVYSLAGRTRAPTLPDCAVRTGGFGGADGLARYLAEGAIAAVIDATHPYAAQMAAHARLACGRAGVPLWKFLRPGWEKPPGARWLEAADIEAAARLIDGRFRRVFLSIGSDDLAAFSGVADAWFLVRTVDVPDAKLPLPAYRLVSARGPFGPENERALLRGHRIDALVTRNSGGTATEAKLHAAAALGIPVVMIARPPPPPGICYDTTERLLAALRDSLPPPGARPAV